MLTKPNAAMLDIFDVDGKILSSLLPGASASTPWAAITGKPTTVAGFGITDAALLSSTAPVALATAAAVGTATTAARADHVHPLPTAAQLGAVAAASVGVANGVAALDGTGKVPATQLPSYVDDVLEYANLAAFPATGAAGVIYVALDTNKVYRWGGSAYVVISSSVGTSDSVVEGTSNLYFTVARAQAAVNSVTGNAGTATKLQNARTISLAGDVSGSATFDGSANVTINATVSGGTGGASLASTAPVALAAVADVGASASAARADHVHPLPTAAQLGVSLSHEFVVNFDASGNPFSVSNLPAGWTAAISATDVTITHTANAPLRSIAYWGRSTSGGKWRHRLPSASNEASIPVSAANSQFTFRVNTSVAGADASDLARVVCTF